MKFRRRDRRYLRELNEMERLADIQMDQLDDPAFQPVRPPPDRRGILHGSGRVAPKIVDSPFRPVTFDWDDEIL